MNFKFYDQFREYSNIELLKIIRKPAEYQAEAVEAAAKVLTERQIIQSDIEQVDSYFQELSDKAKARAGEINSYKDKATDFLDPVLNPGTEVNPVKWLNILLLVAGAEYLWTFYNSIKGFIHFLQCRNCRLDVTIIFTQVSLIYIPIVLFLLYKKKRWGWILLFADNLFSFITILSQSYIFFKYQEFHRGDTSTFLFSILIKGVFVIFLWRKAISDLFSVTDKTKKDTAIVVTIIAVVFAGAMLLLSG